MLAYHGSTVRGIRLLQPVRPVHNPYPRPCVYLTENPALASLYIWSHPFMWLTFHFTQDGTPCYTESFDGSLRRLYAGVPGCIYTCEGAFETPPGTAMRTARVSHMPVPVVHAQPVADAYTWILRHVDRGELRLRRYADLTAPEKASNEAMVLSAIAAHDLLSGLHPMAAFVRQTFPHLWRKALMGSQTAARRQGVEKEANRKP